MQTYSIVIATADRMAYLADCIASWRDQVPPEVELVIVDAGRTAPVDEEAVRRLWANARVIRSPVRNAGVQRNTGVAAAAGGIIIFLDDDTTVHPGWWPTIVAPLAESGGPCACVAGGVWCNPQPTFTDRRGGYVNWRGEVVQVTHRSERAPRAVDWPMTTNMAVTRAAFEQVGGFCELYGVYDEDVDFGLLLRRAGFSIVFEPAASVLHRYLERPQAPATKATRFRDGRNRAMLLTRHFGLGPQTVVFLVCAPFLQLLGFTRGLFQHVWRAAGHTAAYLAGVVAGVRLGWKSRGAGGGGRRSDQ